MKDGKCFMTIHISSVAFEGINTREVDVQVHISESGNSHFAIVGLPDKSISESKERIRPAINSLGLSFPFGRVVVNLAPGDLLKEGIHFDVPIAVGLMIFMGVLPRDIADQHVMVGELSLDGDLTAVNGVLPVAMYAKSKGKGIICPYSNGGEARWAGDLPVIAPQNLLQLVNHFKGTQVLSEPVLCRKNNKRACYPDLKDIKGQEVAKRVLEITAAGGHNLLMVGPPGAGKSMLAARLPGIVPELTSEEMLEISMIASISGGLHQGKLVVERPFRDPHHSCSVAAMVGGGKYPKPGEISLAHNGVLFLDELPEFQRAVLESLRQPIETGYITVARAQSHVTYPANFQLISAMNPCRCGYLYDAEKACSRAPRCGLDYQSKISGPLMDRFDIHLELSAVKPQDLEVLDEGESSSVVVSRVLAARKCQAARYASHSIMLNSQLDGDLLNQYCVLDEVSKSLMYQAVEKMGLSMRGYSRTLRVARSIADLEGENNILKQHVTEALNYRMFQQQLSRQIA